MLNTLSSFEPIILSLHFLICIFLVVVILLQAGKGADMGAAFGAGGSQSLFGARGASTSLQKMTTVVSTSFLLTSISLASIHKKRSVAGGADSVVGDIVPEPVGTQPAPASPEAVTAPAAPAAPAPSEKPAEQPK